jgi:DNA-binding phage protein
MNKIDSGEFDYGQVAEALGKSRKSIYKVFNNLKTGQSSVTIDQILLVLTKFKIKSNVFFGDLYEYPEEITTTFEEATGAYGLDQFEIGDKLREIFDKHETNIKKYAENNLKMSEQNLYKILRGFGRPYWDTIVKICDDHGESLDQFRRTPLPKGHLLAQLKIQETLIKNYEQKILSLEHQLKGKRSSA